MGNTSKRRRFSAAFKAQVAIEALKEQKTLSELASEYNIHSNQISNWKSEFLENSAAVFSTKKNVISPMEREQIESPLFEEIGRLKMENKFLKKASSYQEERSKK
jgi:transposase